MDRDKHTQNITLLAEILKILTCFKYIYRLKFVRVAIYRISLIQGKMCVLYITRNSAHMKQMTQWHIATETLGFVAKRRINVNGKQTKS